MAQWQPASWNNYALVDDAAAGDSRLLRRQVGYAFFQQAQNLDADELVWRFLQIIVAADDTDFESWATRQFATDRKSRPKGVVEGYKLMPGHRF